MVVVSALLLGVALGWFLALTVFSGKMQRQAGDLDAERKQLERDQHDVAEARHGLIADAKRLEYLAGNIRRAAADAELRMAPRHARKAGLLS